MIQQICLEAPIHLTTGTLDMDKNRKGWVVETEEGELFVVEDLLEWCDNIGIAPYGVYRTYGAFLYPKEERRPNFYKGYRIKGKAKNIKV